MSGNLLYMDRDFVSSIFPVWFRYCGEGSTEKLPKFGFSSAKLITDYSTVHEAVLYLLIPLVRVLPIIYYAFAYVFSTILTCFKVMTALLKPPVLFCFRSDALGDAAATLIMPSFYKERSGVSL